MMVYEEIAEKILAAEGILVGASNGFSIAEGLHIFADDHAFEESFGDFKRTYGFNNILSGLFAKWSSEEAKWAFLARLIKRYCLDHTESMAMTALKAIIGTKPYFFVTSNGEAHFELAGFDPAYIWAIEGSWQNMSCARQCHDELYPTFPLIAEMAAAEVHGKIPTALVPRCPQCGGAMTIHIPQYHRTLADVAFQQRYQRFVQTYHDKHLVILELGIGPRNQLIKAPLMQLVQQMPHATYVTVNKGEIFIPETIRAKSYGLDGDMTDVLVQLQHAITTKKGA